MDDHGYDYGDDHDHGGGDDHDHGDHAGGRENPLTTKSFSTPTSECLVRVSSSGR